MLTEFTAAPVDIHIELSTLIRSWVFLSVLSSGLELTGGRDDPDDSAIRIKDVLPGGAASDDSRLQVKLCGL